MGKGEFFVDASGKNTLTWYYVIFGFAEIVGLIALILIGVLFGNLLGGFGWGEQAFNYHPFLMALGMIFFYGNGMLVYRVLPDGKKLNVKILHGLILLTTLILASVGLKAAFQSVGSSGGSSANLKTLHSWFGLTTVILFGLQWVVGFVTYLLPKLSERIRKSFMPSHKVWGRTIFTMALITFMMGIAEYSLSGLSFKSSLLKERNMLYVSGIFFLVFGFLVLYLVVDRDFERPPEDDAAHEHVPLKD